MKTKEMVPEASRTATDEEQEVEEEQGAEEEVEVEEEVLDLRKEALWTSKPTQHRIEWLNKEDFMRRPLPIGGDRRRRKRF